LLFLETVGEVCCHSIVILIYINFNFFSNIASIVDALDTMLIMGLDKEYEEALQFVEKIDFYQSKDSSKGFETNIRYLGGLLAANDLRPNSMLVQKAIEVTEATLIPLFVDTTSLSSKVKVPLAYMNLNKYVHIKKKE
jgi:mannosyl-oligosaccharide alpha-1,2-mannosidase